MDEDAPTDEALVEGAERHGRPGSAPVPPDA